MEETKSNATPPAEAAGGRGAFIIKEKIYEMIRYGSPALLQFPKSERYELAGRIRARMYGLLEYAVIVEKKYYKKTTLQDMDVELDVLRHLIRLAADRKLYPTTAAPLPFKKYEYWAKMLDEIGRMLGGYMKTVKQ